MSDVLEGDEWKTAPEPPAVYRRETRSQQQQRADRDYADRKIDAATWRRWTDYISGLQADGKPRPGRAVRIL